MADSVREKSLQREAHILRSAKSTDAPIREALEFVASCLGGTPLARHAHRFHPDLTPSGSVLREGLSDALSVFRTDLARWGLELDPAHELFERLLLLPNLQAPFFYRVARALHLREVELLPDVIAMLGRLLTGVEIYYSAAIGPGLKVIHGIGTVIGARVRIGSRFTVYHGATLGDKLGRDSGGRPVIGDQVIVSTGAQILGSVTVGDRVVIGANAVVIHSLPARCVAGGAPARVLVADLSEERFLEYWNSFRG